MRKSWLVGPAVLALVAGSVALFAGDVAVAATTNVTTTGNTAFQPTDVTVQVGDQVKWTFSTAGHSVTADSLAFDSHPTCPTTCSTQAETYTVTFNAQAANIPYYCRAHGAPGGVGMHGVIHVVAASATPTATATATATPTATATATASASPSGGTTPAQISLGVNVPVITAGNKPLLSGFVRNASGNGIPSKTVQIFQKQWGTSLYVNLGSATTDSIGRFTFPVTPQRQSSFGANIDALRAPTVLVKVHQRINVLSPMANTSVGRRVTFSGNLLPPDPNIPVGLAMKSGGVYTYLSQGNSQGNGTWNVTGNLPAGTATYVLYTSAHHGLLYGSKSLLLTAS